MEHVLWIGGPPASGKTTVATWLARRHGLRLYRADTQTWRHRDRALLTKNAAALRWEAMSARERWETSTPQEMFEMSLHRERGQMVLDDVRELGDSAMVVVEGSVVPAWVVSRREALPSQAAWLLPTERFQAEQLAARGTGGGQATLYRMLAEVITREAHDAGVPVVTVDETQSALDVGRAIEELFANAIARGPRAEGAAARSTLLREMNLATIGQVRGYYARPWAYGDPETVMLQFVCECGACLDDITLAVGTAANGAVLAPGHELPRGALPRRVRGR